MSNPTIGGGYRYTADLLTRDGCRAPRYRLPSRRFAGITTPLILDHWRNALGNHPDRAMATLITDSIWGGFRIGFGYGTLECRSADRDMRSAAQCDRKISEYLAEECAAGRVLGPLPRDMVPMVHLSRVGAVPKSTPGK